MQRREPLPLDADAAARVHRMWTALAEQAGADDAIRLGYVPHVTLAVIADGAPVSEVEAAVSRVVADWRALPAVLAGVGVLPGATPTGWAAPVVTNALLPAMPRYAGASPALTFTRTTDRGTGCRISPLLRARRHWRAVQAAASAWEGSLPAMLESVELVRFPPVAVLRRWTLQAGR